MQMIQSHICIGYYLWLFIQDDLDKITINLKEEDLSNDIIATIGY